MLSGWSTMGGGGSDAKNYVAVITIYEVNIYRGNDS